MTYLGAVWGTMASLKRMRSRDRGWLKLKLDALAKAGGDDGFDMPFPPRGEKKRMPSVVSAFAQVVRWREGGPCARPALASRSRFATQKRKLEHGGESLGGMLKAQRGFSEQRWLSGRLHLGHELGRLLGERRHVARGRVGHHLLELAQGNGAGGRNNIQADPRTNSIIIKASVGGTFGPCW